MTTDRRAFTLVELLVVIAVISVLAALLMPALKAAFATSRAVVCMNNLRQAGVMIDLYAHDHAGRAPIGDPYIYNTWWDLQANYHRNIWWADFLYEAGLMEVIPGFGSLGGGSSTDLGSHRGYYFQPNSSPSLLCPSGTNAIDDAGTPLYSDRSGSSKLR